MSLLNKYQSVTFLKFLMPPKSSITSSFSASAFHLDSLHSFPTWGWSAILVTCFNHYILSAQWPVALLALLIQGSISEFYEFISMPVDWLGIALSVTPEINNFELNIFSCSYWILIPPTPNLTTKEHSDFILCILAIVSVVCC
jgi:O-antigen ligase